MATRANRAVKTLAFRHRNFPAKAWKNPPPSVLRILKAAEDIFANYGLAGARVDQIARAAGVTKALLYYYFPSKKKLHRATLSLLFSERAKILDNSSDRPRDILLAYVDGYFDFMNAHPNFSRCVQREILSH